MERIEFELGPHRGAAVHYALLARLNKALLQRDCRLLGFRIDHRVQALVEGPSGAIALAIRGTKVGTVRQLMHRGQDPYLGRTKRFVVYDPTAALAALHRQPDGPLSSPWTSHRDLLGFRDAPFFDRTVWAHRIDPRRVHIEAGGGPLPFGWPPDLGIPSENLGLELRIAAGVIGVLPANPRCFRLFAHLTRWIGAGQRATAAALMLTPRRIRQLTAQPEPLLQAAALTLADDRLRRVP